MSILSSLTFGKNPPAQATYECPRCKNACASTEEALTHYHEHCLLEITGDEHRVYIIHLPEEFPEEKDPDFWFAQAVATIKNRYPQRHIEFSPRSFDPQTGNFSSYFAILF